MTDLKQTLESMLARAKDEFVPLLVEEAEGLLEGAAEDIRQYATAIATDSARAVLIQNDERRKAVLDENIAQLHALAELNRIRAEQAAMETFRRIAGTAMKTFVGVAVAAL